MNDILHPDAMRHPTTQTNRPEGQSEPTTGTKPHVADRVIERLPSILRIESLTRTLDDAAVLNRATLHHRQASLCVEWANRHVDTRLHVGGLVCIRPARARAFESRRARQKSMG